MNYVLINSCENDYSTSEVINWLNYLGQKVIRVNYESSFFLFKLELEDNKPFAIFKVDNEIINTNDIKSFWYRRGDIKIDSKIELNVMDEVLKKEITAHLSSELRELKNALHFILEDRKHIGSIFNYSINKIKMLLLANKVGLDVPKTMICNTRKDFNDFTKKHGSLITKSIQEMKVFEIDDEVTNKYEMYGLYTTEVNSELIENIPESFLYSNFQEKIDKEIEIRIFILCNKVYSMAIFSQNNLKTKIDFRQYDSKLPNRNIPFNLPEEIKDKLLLLMNELNLNTGSADMILTKDGRYVFLEINPIGQFSMVSHPCNYYLEKQIAEYLMN